MADSPEMTPPPAPGVHAATASALASLFGALPAALLGEYKTAGIVAIGASGLAILFYALAAWAKFQDSMKSKDRKLVERGAFIALIAVSWSVTIWALYSQRHSTPQAVAQPSPASASQTTSPAPAATHPATADPPAGTTVNNIQNSGTANPIITGGSGSVYIGDSVQADRGGKSNAKHR